MPVATSATSAVRSIVRYAVRIFAPQLCVLSCRTVGVPGLRDDRVAEERAASDRYGGHHLAQQLAHPSLRERGSEGPLAGERLRPQRRAGGLQTPCEVPLDGFVRPARRGRDALRGG